LLAGGDLGANLGANLAPVRAQEHHEVAPAFRGKPLRRVSRKIGRDVSISAPQPLAAARQLSPRSGRTNAPPPSSFKPTFSSRDSSSRSILRTLSRGSFSSRLERTHSDAEADTPKRTILHRLSRSISVNLSKVFKAHGNLLSPEGTQTTPATPEPQIKFPSKLKSKRSRSKVSTVRMRTDSASSRDSMVSVMEYLAKKRLKEESEVDLSTPVTLEEYAKHCYLYDCDLLHIANPNRHEGQSPVIHCGCDPARPSRRHSHINDPPEVRQAILALKKDRERVRDTTHQREQSAPQPLDKPPTRSLVASKELPSPDHLPRKRTGHVSRRPDDMPTALITALNEARAQTFPRRTQVATTLD